MATLDSAVAKLERARRHGEELQRDIERTWGVRRMWPVTSERSASGLEIRFYLGNLPAIDPEWALVIGEILFDLRSALDHLAYSLHARRHRGRIPKGVEMQSQFPIYSSESAWTRNLHRIRTLSSQDQRALRHLQPFVVRKDKWKVHRTALENLSRLHNFDKHRALHVVTCSQVTAFFPESHFPEAVGFESSPVWGPVAAGGMIDRWTFTAPPDAVEDHPGAEIAIAIEFGSEWALALGILFAMHQAVTAVLRRFESRFPVSEKLEIQIEASDGGRPSGRAGQVSR